MTSGVRHVLTAIAFPVVDCTDIELLRQNGRVRALGLRG
jgi:hypothetical protein